jgi:glycerol uptake facilitator-like aquaporin
MLARKLACEALGTTFLLVAVVGSGIMGERLAGGNVAIALLANAVATGAALVAIILTFESISGAHLNPAVTLADASQGGVQPLEAAAYIAVQVPAAILGVVAANLLFGEPAIAWSQHARSGAAQMSSEFVATFGLLGVIWGTLRNRPTAVPFAVGAYITAAYWFTPSTSFANPAVTIGRAFTNTFAGIRPADVAGFVGAQLAGAAAASLVFRWLVPALPIEAREVVVPHGPETQAATRPAASSPAGPLRSGPGAST